MHLPFRVAEYQSSAGNSIFFELETISAPSVQSFIIPSAKGLEFGSRFLANSIPLFALILCPRLPGDFKTNTFQLKANS